MAEELELTSEQLRKLQEHAEDMNDWHATFESALKTGSEGMWPCGACRANADWTRLGRDWSIECSHCGWNAAGTMRASEVPPHS